MPSFKLAHIAKPTPKKWRMIGNALLSVSGSAGSFAFVADHKPMAYILFGCAVLGKFICSLTTTDNATQQSNTTGGSADSNGA